MSRTLNDDFDEDDLPGGPLDLEKGSHVGAAGAVSSYEDSGSIDFDDDLYGDDGPKAALELDMPQGPPQSGRTLVPDLAFEDAPPRSGGAPGAKGVGPAPAPHSSGQHLAAHPSGAHPAARTSGAHPAAPPSGADLSIPPAPPSESNPHIAPPPSSSGSLKAAAAPPEPPPPPPKPTAASIIAKFPPAPEKITGAPMYAFRVVMRQLELRTDLESLRRRRSPDVPLYEAALRAYDAKTFRLGIAINGAVFAVLTFIFFLPVIIRFMRAD